MPEALGRIESSARSGARRDARAGRRRRLGREHRRVRDAGADLLVAGSAIFWQDDPAAAYRGLTAKAAGLCVRHPAAPENHVIVLFGATGDLARRKLLPGLFNLHCAGLMPEDYRIIGVSRAASALSDEEFRAAGCTTPSEVRRHAQGLGSRTGRTSSSASRSRRPTTTTLPDLVARRRGGARRSAASPAASTTWRSRPRRSRASSAMLRRDGARTSGRA